MPRLGVSPLAAIRTMARTPAASYSSPSRERIPASQRRKSFPLLGNLGITRARERTPARQRRNSFSLLCYDNSCHEVLIPLPRQSHGRLRPLLSVPPRGRPPRSSPLPQQGADLAAFSCDDILSTLRSMTCTHTRRTRHVRPWRRPPSRPAHAPLRTAPGRRRRRTPPPGSGSRCRRRRCSRSSSAR